MPLDETIALRTGETVPLTALEFSTSRSGGPGGQNVNKVETKVEVRMQIEGSEWLQEPTRVTLMKKLSSRIDKSGWLRLASSSERTQLGNKQAVVARLEELLDKALTPTKKRRATRPTLSSKIKRLDTKKRDSVRKSNRKVSDDT